MTISMTIKSRFILTIGAVVLLSGACLGIYSYRHQSAQLLNRFEDLARNESRLFETILRADEEGLRRALVGLSRLEAFHGPFAARDRTALQTAARPVFEELKAAHDISHMYFIAPDGTVLLRVHRPEQFGDILNRSSYRQAAATRSTAAALEMGLNFFSLRCVTPVYSKGDLLGYLEVAEEVDHIFEHMKTITGNDTALFLSKAYIERYEVNLPTGDGGAFAVMYPTSRVLTLQIAEQLSDLVKRGLKDFAVGAVALGDERYVVGVGPLRDAFGETAGVLFTQRNVTHNQNAIWSGVVASLAVFAGILVAGNFVLFASMRKSLNLLHAVRCHIQSLTRNWALDRRLEVNTSDEIGELAEDLNLMQDEILKLKDSLERKAEELATSNQELESFSYTLSHDLRSPLTRVYTAAELIAQNYGESLDETGRMLLDNICKGCEGMESLIEAVLMLANIVRKEMHGEVLDLAGMAREVADELALADPDRSVDVVIAEGLICSGDRQLLMIVLRNLLENAWKYTHPVTAPRIEVGVVEQPGKKVFFVRDNGVGFDMQQAAKLFVPFKRLHDASTFPGTGIGLATVQKIILRHGGSVWGSGKPGEGATFFFTLP